MTRARAQCRTARGVTFLNGDPLGGRLRGEAVDGLRLGVVGVEDREELRDRQQVLEPLGQAHQLDLGAIVLGRHGGCDERAEAGAVDVGDGAHIEDDLLFALEHQAMNLVFQQCIAVAEYELSAEIENCHRANDALLNRHVLLLVRCTQRDSVAV